ncbi:MAG TPA: hypothetical protein PK544_14405 [Spirochaetota bacterium]|nr:hypothetical protein [Spirochaetota bacterium]
MTSVNRILELIIETVQKKIVTVVSYFNIVYYFEIINLMILLFFLFGKITAVLSGLTLSLLLSWHIIMLFFRKQNNRKIQLFLMDIHVAISAGIIIRTISSPLPASAVQTSLLTMRILVVLCELLLIFILTDEEVIESF